MKWIAAYLALINLLGFVLMGADKKRARRGARRIPEKTLLGIAAAGGSAGVALGMAEFRHKTLHKRFTVGVPVMLIIQAALCAVWVIRLAA